jgi:putative peptidoglycan lipid II flippase
MLVKSALVTTIFSILNLSIRLVYGLLQAKQFGSGYEMDAFLVANTVPAFFITVLTGIINIVVLPAVTPHFQDQNSNSKAAVNALLTAFLTLMFFTLMVIFVFLPEINGMVTAGFSHEKADLTLSLSRIFILNLFFLPASDLLSNLFYVRFRFLWPQAIKLLQPFMMVLALIIFGDRWGIKPVVYASLFGGACQFVGIIFLLHRIVKADFQLNFKFGHPIVKKTFIQMGSITGVMIFWGLPLFDRWLASSLQEGSISNLGYASRLMDIFGQILLAGISVSLFPLLTHYACNGDKESLIRTAHKVISVMLFISIPISVMTVISGRGLIELLLFHGKFKETDVEVTYQLFRIYMMGFPALSISWIASQCFFAMKQIRIPALWSFFQSTIYIFAILFLFTRYQIFAFPIGYGILFSVGVWMGTYSLGRSLGHPFILKMLSSAVRPLIASGLAGVVIFLILQSSWINILYGQLITMMIGFALYWLIQRFVFKSEDVREVEGIFKKIIPRWQKGKA